jgi:hypothetical protein
MRTQVAKPVEKIAAAMNATAMNARSALPFPVMFG